MNARRNFLRNLSVGAVATATVAIPVAKVKASIDKPTVQGDAFDIEAIIQKAKDGTELSELEIRLFSTELILRADSGYRYSKSKTGPGYMDNGALELWAAAQPNSKNILNVHRYCQHTILDVVQGHRFK